MGKEVDGRTSRQCPAGTGRTDRGANPPHSHYVVRFRHDGGRREVDVAKQLNDRRLSKHETRSYMLTLQQWHRCSSPPLSGCFLPTPTLASPPTPVDTWTRPAEGMVMVCMPAGEFIMGGTEGDRTDPEHPQNYVHLDAHSIDRTKVSNAQYPTCVALGTCEVAPGWNPNDMVDPNATLGNVAFLGQSFPNCTLAFSAVALHVAQGMLTSGATHQQVPYLARPCSSDAKGSNIILSGCSTIHLSPFPNPGNRTSIGPKNTKAVQQ